MPNYRVTFRLRDPCPEDLSKNAVSADGRTYELATDAKLSTIAISPIEADTRTNARNFAYSLVNRLLDRLAAQWQYCTIIDIKYYRAQNLDDSKDSVQVLALGTAKDYSCDPALPQLISLDSELTGTAFFRLGETSNHPFDQFRNYFLTVSSIGRTTNRAIPERNVIEQTIEQVISTRDIVDLHRRLEALVEQFKEQSLSKEAQLTGCPETDLNHVLYGKFRCSLMHSGQVGDFIPFNHDDEVKVSLALPLMRDLAWQYVEYSLGRSRERKLENS